MGPADIVGTLAAIVSTATLLPQTIRVLKTRDTRAISGATFAIVCASTTLWGIYGVLIGSWPVIITNVLTFPMGAIILALKIKQIGDDRRG